MNRVALLVLLSCLSFPTFARGHGGHSGQHNSNYTHGVARDSHGKIARSASAKNEFKKATPCPSGGHGSCSGYVVDHVVPLKRGGADNSANMQWMTKEAAKEKDRWE